MVPDFSSFYFIFILYSAYYRGHKSGVRVCNQFYLSQLGFLHDQFLVLILRSHAAPPAVLPHYSHTPIRPPKKKDGRGKRERKRKEKERKERKIKEQRKDKGNVHSHT